MKKILFTIIIASALVVSCYKNAVTGKRSMTLMPEGELIGMSLTEYDKFLTEHPKLNDNDSRVQLVRSCGIKIQKAVEQFHAEKGASKDLEGFKWEFNVVDENTINAWCMPGGKVVVYTGLLPVTQDEQSLAVVMGHEIAHAIARHGNQRMSQGLLLQFGGAALSVALSQKPELTQQLFQQAYGITSTLGTLKYSRSHESEADQMGLIFAAMAGYNPEAAITFWERMAASGGQKPPELLSTHPSDETRIKDLKAFMPEAKKYYKP
ncbi:M48 family metallopeptidase [Aurantibacillus circumpalustris]|uniref:M48 family metallopeptidase n=1 Tax=Aurantibacillus circumpalustris TaxID=3036359 RepID=UPI00295C16C2|nr:M48 family metallopeptidase [Aurantibacillus circumpalustris]